MKLKMSISILLLVTITSITVFCLLGFKTKEIIDSTKSIVELIAIFIGIFFISTWKIDRKEQLKEDLQVSFNNIKKVIQGYIGHPWFFHDPQYESQRTQKPSGVAINEGAKQEVLEYRDARISRITDNLFQLKTNLNQSLFLARLHGIIKDRTEKEIEEGISQAYRKLPVFLRNYGNVMCLHEDRIDKHTEDTRAKEKEILKYLDDIETIIKKSC